MKKFFNVAILIILFICMIGTLLPSHQKKEWQDLRISIAKKEMAIERAQRSNSAHHYSVIHATPTPSAVKLDGKDVISFADFRSAIENFSPIENMGEVTSYSEGYREIFLTYEEGFYFIPLEHGIDPKYVFCLGLWTTEYGSSELAFVENDVFGEYEFQPSIPHSIIKCCSSLKGDEQYTPEPEVLELIQEIFPE